MEVETCCDCGGPEESIYTPAGRGPFCENCYKEGEAIDARGEIIIAQTLQIAECERKCAELTERNLALYQEVRKLRRPHIERADLLRPLLSIHRKVCFLNDDREDYVCIRCGETWPCETALELGETA